MKKNRVLGCALFLSLLVGTSGDACTTLLVGKERSATGQVMLAHSEELGTNRAQRLYAVERQTHKPGDVFVSDTGARIPQPAQTWRYIASRGIDEPVASGDVTSGINEWGVTLANNMSWTRDIDQEKAWLRAPGAVVWEEFTQLVLERARTAREGVALIGELCDTYGFTGDPGTMFAVADAHEGWWIEIARGNQWVAVRVPDDAVSVRANGYRIGSVEAKEGEALRSAGLVDYAAKQGWYDPAKGNPFDFAHVYGHPWVFDSWNTMRTRQLEMKLGALPRVGRGDLFEALRWTYEGTNLYKGDPKTGSPLGQEDRRTVASLYTEVACVAEPGPAGGPVGSLMWWSLSGSKSGVFLPWFVGTRSFPRPWTLAGGHFDSEAAYWQFCELKWLTHEHYNDVFASVDAVWKGMERRLSDDLPSLRARAEQINAEMGSDAAVSYLEEASDRWAAEAFAKARELIGDIKTRIWYLE